MGRARRLKIEALEADRLERLAKGENVPSVFKTKPESPPIRISPMEILLIALAKKWR